MKVFDGFGLSVDGELTPQALNEAKKLAADTRREAEARGLQAFRKYRRLPNGGYATATKHDDVLRIRLVLPPKKVDPKRRPPFRLPTFASGWYSAEPLVGTTPQPVFYPAETTRVKFSGRDQAQRFLTTDSLHANWYSGQMEKLVQYLYAIGKEPPDTPDLYGSVLRQLLTERREGLPRTMSAWHQKVLTDGMTNLYDYSASRTHGVTVAADGRRWIVEIGERGVYATPMKYWPYTDVPRFKQLVSTVDPEAVTVIDAFGGMPTGESVPTDTDLLNAARRAGLVIQLATDADIRQVYYATDGKGDWGALSEGFGWAFNPNGSAAHLVMYRSPQWDTTGTFWRFYWPQFRHWSAQLSIDASTLLRPKTAAMDRLIARLSNYAAVSVEYREIVLEKIRYLTDNQVFDLLGEPSTSRCFQLLDALVLNPIASGSARFTLHEEGAINKQISFTIQQPTSRVGSGLYMTPILTTLPPAPPGEEFTVRFAFIPATTDASAAPVHVWWHGDELKVLRWCKGPYTDPATTPSGGIVPPPTDVQRWMWPGRPLRDPVSPQTSNMYGDEGVAFPSARGGAAVWTYENGGLWNLTNIPNIYGVPNYNTTFINGNHRTETYLDLPPFAETKTLFAYSASWTWTDTSGFGIDGEWSDAVRLYNGGPPFSSFITQVFWPNYNNANHYSWVPTERASPPVFRTVWNAFGNSNAAYYNQSLTRRFPDNPDVLGEGYVDNDYWNGFTIQEGELWGSVSAPKDGPGTQSRFVRQKRKTWLVGEPAAYGMTVEDQQGWVARKGFFKFVGVV